MIHFTHPDLLERFSVAVVGAGGNGSQLLTCLARLDHAVRALGHPGMDVAVFDPDTISAANVGRQMFSPADVGQHKADVLVGRINTFFGCDWQARPTALPTAAAMRVRDRIDEYQRARTLRTRIEIRGRFPALWCICVDTAAARRDIAELLRTLTRHDGLIYVLDLGNRAADGQVLLGQIGSPAARKSGRRPRHADYAGLAPQMEAAAPASAGLRTMRAGTATPAAGAPSIDIAHALPDPYTLLPELVDPRADTDTAPSCSLAEALERQELFVNDDVVRVAAQLLWQLLRHGRLEWHGAFVNTSSGTRRPVPVDQEIWAAMAGGRRKEKRK